MRAPKSTSARVAIAALSLSAAGLVGIAVREGYTDEAIIPTKGDVPTLGFGMTYRPDGSRVQLGDRTNPVDALQRTLAYVKRDESRFKQCVTVPLHQAEFDLWLKFAYNIGMPNFCASTAARRLNAENYAGACEAILMWKKAGGGKHDCSVPGNKICAGVWTDRLAAHASCMALQ